MGAKLIKSKNLWCLLVVFTRSSLLSKLVILLVFYLCDFQGHHVHMETCILGSPWGPYQRFEGDYLFWCFSPSKQLLWRCLPHVYAPVKFDFNHNWAHLSLKMDLCLIISSFDHAAKINGIIWFLSGQTFLHWAAATLKGLAEFQNKKILDHFSP